MRFARVFGPTSRFVGAAALACLITTGATAAVILDFSGVSTNNDHTPTPIGGFYNGGVSGDGTSGTNYGVSFGVSSDSNPSSNVSVVNTYNGCCEPDSHSGKKGVMTIGPDRFGDELTLINVEGGFTKMLSFDFASFCFVAFEIHSGLNGTGGYLAGGSFNRDNGPDVPCAPDATGSYCFWQTAVVPFSGTAKSFYLTTASPNSALFDRLAFGFRSDLFPGGVPEPSVWAELTIGFGLAGAARRRQRSPRSIAS